MWQAFPFHPRRRGGGQRGMALIAVLWLVAALSIMVTGISGVVRQESRMQTLARQKLEAQALGDAALMLVLQQLVTPPQPVRQWTETTVNFNGTAIAVSIMPLSGLININSASIQLLTALLTIGGGLPDGQAQQIAINIVDTRERRASDGRSAERFEAIEDLMRVPGIDYDLYARLAPLVTADSSSGGSGVDPMAAPPEVLLILAGGNQAVAERIVAARASGQPGVDTSGIDTGLASGASSRRRFRLSAAVPLADGGTAIVERSVYFGSRTRDGLPWYTFETHQAIRPASK